MISGLKNIWITKMKQLCINLWPQTGDIASFHMAHPLCYPLLLPLIYLTDLCHTGHALKLPKWSLRNVQQLHGHNLIVNSDNCKIQIRFPFLISEILFWELILGFWFLDLKEFSRNSKKDPLNHVDSCYK